MTVHLIHNSPLKIADIAISKCYDKPPYEELEKQQGRINRVANVSKHASTIEHLNYSFDVKGTSRAVLQELARHRIASYTVKSTRYTLQELKKEGVFFRHKLSGVEVDVEGASEYLVLTGHREVDIASIAALERLRELIVADVPRDKAKYALPEAYKTDLVMTFNARSLQNFLALRSSPHALWEIQELAQEVYKEIPNDHKFLFEGSIADG